MKKVGLNRIDVKNIYDIMYEPDKDRYSILEYNSSRKETVRADFLSLIYDFGRKKR